MKKDNLLNNERMTIDEFLKKNQEVLDEYTEPLDNGKPYYQGKLGNKDDLEAVKFRGIYVIIEDNNVLYIGSALPQTRTIKVRLQEHINGNSTHTSIVTYLSKRYNTNDAELAKTKALDLIKTFDFLAFKYTSLEYKLIEETKGIINKKGKYINH